MLWMWRFVEGIEWTPIVKRVEYSLNPAYRVSRVQGLAP